MGPGPLVIVQLNKIETADDSYPFWFKFFKLGISCHFGIGMAFADIIARFVLYTDGDDNAIWIHDRRDERRWTKSEVAIQLLRAIVVAHTGLTRTPQPPAGPPPPLCQRQRLHAISMFNGMPWESQQSIGRDLTHLNWISPGAGTCQSWMQRLFQNTHYSDACPGTGFEAAILQSHAHLAWASMETHKARYFGIASKCRHCQQICRIAWTLSSTAQHMKTQRAHILSWLNLPYEMPGQENAVPAV